MSDSNPSIRQTSWFQRLARFLPIVGWLSCYRRDWLLHDLVAGLTLAAYAVPVAMAYSSLAGLAPQVGLYCYIFGGIAYAFFGTSRHLAVGPTAAISLMVAGVVGTMALGNPASYAAIASLTAAIVSLICFLAWLMRLSTFVSFISQSIMLGFKAGAALSIGVTQLPKLLGIPGGGDNFFERLLAVLQQSGDISPIVAAIGVGALLVLLTAGWLFPGQPAALAVVIISTTGVYLFDLAVRGIAVVGLIPAGLPDFGLPHIASGQVESLLELAFACFLLSYVESIAAAKTFAEKYDYSVNPHQELLGLGAANLMSALMQGYPVAGGLSQTAVNEKAGARSPMALIFSSLALALVLIFLTGLLSNLPQAVLAAIVLVAVAGFVKISSFRELRRISRLEFNVAMVAFIAVLLLGILKGVAVSAIASILFLLRMLARPHVATLGRIPGSIRFSDAVRHTNNETFPGLYLFRVEAPLLYFNADSITKTVLENIAKEPQPVRLAVCDLSTSPYIDAAGARMLDRLEEQLTQLGTQFRVVEAHAEVREILRATGISERLGGVSRHTALADIVEDFERDSSRMSSIK